MLVGSWAGGVRSLFRLSALLGSCVPTGVKEQHRGRGAVVPQGGGGSELLADRKVFGPQQGSWVVVVVVGESCLLHKVPVPYQRRMLCRWAGQFPEVM